MSKYPAVNIRHLVIFRSHKKSITKMTSVPKKSKNYKLHLATHTNYIFFLEGGGGFNMTSCHVNCTQSFYINYYNVCIPQLVILLCCEFILNEINLYHLWALAHFSSMATAFWDRSLEAYTNFFFFSSSPLLPSICESW